MCGIVGSTHPPLCPPDAFASMVACLQRRGPDAGGAWRDHRIALGHRRLAILDLSPRGAQPYLLEGGLIAGVYNGECYNHADLRQRFLSDIPFQSDCDTETLLRLYERLGPDFVQHTNGMMALAIYDQRGPSPLLHLWRDRLGIKPLYWTRQPSGVFAFASQLGSLMAHPALEKPINRDALREYLLFNFVPAPQCLLEGVHQLEPGSHLQLDMDTGQITIRRWWSLPQPAPEGFAAPAHIRPDWREELPEFEALLADAVRLRTLADVPLGCFLSGGIDSSLVAALLAKESTHRIKTFTIAFDDPAYNEGPHARAVAERLGAEHHELVARPEDCLALIPELPRICDEPFADTSILPTTLLCRLTRQHVTVALSGDGGDETGLGYDRYLWAGNVRSRSARLPAPLRRAGAALLAALPHYKAQMIGNGLRYRSRRELYGHIFIGWNAPWADRLLADGELRDFNDHPFHALYDEAGQGSLARRAAYADLRRYLPDDILTKVDRASMAFGLEARVPLLDYRLVERSLTRPAVDWVESRAEQKLLLKEVLFRHLPRELFERPKSGFAVPLKTWFRGPLRSLLHDTLSPQALRRHGLLREATVRTLLRRHDSGRYNHERQLWALLVFQSWYETNFP